MMVIEDTYKTAKAWDRYLASRFYDYDSEMLEGVPENGQLSANEVLNRVVSWLGGVADGMDIKLLIKAIYDVQL